MRKSNLIPCWTVLILILASFIPQKGFAGNSLVWDGSTDGNWSSTGNWGGTAPANGNGDDLTFNATSVGIISTTNDISPLSVTKITVSNTPGLVSVRGSGVSLVGAGGVGIDLNSGGSLNMTSAVTINNSMNFNVATGQALTLSAVTSGANTLTLQAVGTGAITNGGVITGTAGLIKSGTGTLVLGAANTFTGGTTINAGTVRISGDNNLGGSAGAISFGGSATLLTTADVTTTGNRGITLVGTNTFDIANTTTTTLSGVIAGGGTLLKENSGTLILSGANTYTGNTTLNSGTLVINAANGIGVQAVLSTTALNVTGDSTLKAGSSFTLGGNTGFTVANTKTLTFDSNGNSNTINGVIAGSGAFTKIGTGTLTLGGVNTYSGTTTFNAGTVIAGANYTGGGAITVGASGSLFGGSRSFTTSGLTLNGNLTPGTQTTPGNMNVTGNLTGNGIINARFQSDTVFDKLTLTGSGSVGTLSGLTYVPSFSYSPALGTQFTIVDASGGGGAAVSGAFNLSTVNLNPTLQIGLVYNAANVILIVRNNLSSPLLNLSPTQMGVSQSLNSASTSADLTFVETAIGQLISSEEVRAAYDQITPLKLENLTTSSFSAATEQTGNIGARMDALHTGSGGSFGFVDNHSASWNFDGSLLADNNATAGLIQKSKIVSKTNDDESPWGVFVNGSGVFGDQDSTPGRTGYEFTSAGMTLGADYKLNTHFAAGVAAGYTRTETTLDASGGTAKIDTGTFGPYANFNQADLNSDFYINSALTYGHNFYNTERHIAFGSIDRTAKGDPEGNQVSALLATGYDRKIGGFLLGPTASVQYTKQWIDQFTETNAGALNLTVGDQSAQSLQTGVGAHLAYEWNVQKILVIPSIFGSYQHEFLNDSHDIKANLAGGSAFQTKTSNPHRDFANVGCGINVKLTKSISMNLAYGTVLGDDSYTEQSVNGGLRVAF